MAIVPEHTLNLYASYEVQEGILEGLGNGGTIRLQLALKNILDEEYFVGTGSPGRIPLGIPRTVFRSVSFDF